MIRQADLGGGTREEQHAASIGHHPRRVRHMSRSAELIGECREPLHRRVGEYELRPVGSECGRDATANATCGVDDDEGAGAVECRKTMS